MMKKQILLIDDDPDELTILSAAVATAGFKFECVGADSATAGLEWLKQNLPDYIFVDINMPQIKDLTCLSMLRNQPRINTVPKKEKTTNKSDFVCKSALGLGATYCLKKAD